VPINRTNLGSAINSLTKASKKIAKYGRAVAIAPEGTRTPNGELQSFKKGPFHLAKGASTIYESSTF
jgi:1-acyl-sn-glycerol-3-phosphate acyltransferase